MRIMRRLFLAILFPVALHAQGTDAVVAIVGGTLIDGNGGPPVPNATVIIRGSRIAAVGPSATTAVPRGARVIEASGKYILPGFVDANVHVSIYSGIENFARYQDRFTDVVIEAAQ
jgi:imidazolonepropionase-like amidohydrolase